MLNYNESELNWQGIYDEYLDFEVCSLVWK